MAGPQVWNQPLFAKFREHPVAKPRVFATQLFGRHPTSFTGLQINFWQLRENWNPEEPMTMAGEPFTLETYEKGKIERRSATNKDRADADLRIHQMLCTALLDTAAKAGKYHVVLATLTRRTEELIKEFSLEKEWSSLLKHHALKEIPLAPHLAFRSADPKQFEQKREEFYSELKRRKLPGKSAKKHEHPLP